MISFCIPIYNQDVNALVDSIIEQAEEIDIPFQILCFDDRSLPEYKLLNRKLGLKLNVSYTELSENIGRSKIRNKMAKFARYDWMVFLDGDSKVARNDFVARYVEIKGKQNVVYGGREYSKESLRPEYRLHHAYGNKYESTPVPKRLQNRYTTFLSNNFLVSKWIMSRYAFDESLETYGYEDLEWAERLKRDRIMIHHIDNPVIHLGLDTNEAFMNKTEDGIKNLVSLYSKNKISESRLIKFYEFSKSIKIIGLFRFWFDLRKNGIKTKLSMGKGNLLQLQAYKLGLFDFLIKQK